MSSLRPDKTCKITLSLWPSQVGNVSAILNLQDNTAGSPQQVTITAMVIAPKGDADPSSLSFGSQPLNTTSTMPTVTLSNPGAGSLTISGIALGGPNPTDFLVQSTTCGSSLAQGPQLHDQRGVSAQGQRLALGNAEDHRQCSVEHPDHVLVGQGELGVCHVMDQSKGAAAVLSFSRGMRRTALPPAGGLQSSRDSTASRTQST